MRLRKRIIMGAGFGGPLAMRQLRYARTATTAALGIRRFRVDLREAGRSREGG
jgi:hypothetical protein